MSISGFKINGTVEKYNYADLADIDVQTNHIHDSAVTRNKIADGEVIGNKIADGAVTRNKIADGAIGNDEIENGAVSVTKLGSDVINVLDNKANVDGAYEQMTVGNAEQLVSTVGITDKAPYNFRTSGGSVDIGDRETDKIIGGTVCWNQLAYGLDSDHWQTDGSATVSYANGIATVLAEARYGGIEPKYDYRPPNAVTGEKVIAIADVKISGSDNTGVLTLNGTHKGIFGSSDWQTVGMIVDWDGSNNNRFRIRDQRTSDWNTFYVKNVIVVNLTRAFGTIIADYVYSLEQTTSGAGVTWFKKLFPEAQNAAYSSPSLLSVKTSSHKMTGFNQWDEEWEVGGITNGVPDSTTNKIRSKNYCRCVENTVYYGYIGVNRSLDIWFYDGNHNVIGSDSAKNRAFTTPNGACYFKLRFESGYGKTYNNDVCINIRWDGERDGEYEAYQEWSYALDSDLELRGIPKLDANNKLYYDGDTYASDGTVTRRYGVVDLGTLTWSKPTATEYMNFYSLGIQSLVKIPETTNEGCKILTCAEYSHGSATSTGDKYIYINTVGQIRVKDTARASLTASEFKSAMSGVYLVYELASPTTESADAYQNLQIVNDWGTEEYADHAYYQGTRDVAIPVGHDTLYAANLRAKLEMSPNSPDGDGLYAVRQSGGINTYEEIIFPTELPPAPASDGTYRFVCTVADGVATYSWAAN